MLWCCVVEDAMILEEISKKLIHKLTTIIKMIQLTFNMKMCNYYIIELRNNMYNIALILYQINPSDPSAIISKEKIYFTETIRVEKGSHTSV